MGEQISPIQLVVVVTMEEEEEEKIEYIMQFLLGTWHMDQLEGKLREFYPPYKNRSPPVSGTPDCALSS